MTLLQINLIVEAASKNSVSAAAQELGIAQSNASQTIKKLEEELGFPIFRRTYNGIALTEEGHLFLKDYDREVFAVINFQTNLQPINMNIVSVGALNASMVHPREMLKSIVLSNSAAVMLVHNHPSGQVQPSAEDISVTAKMSQLMKLMEVSLLDHIILGPGEKYYSFHESDVRTLNGEAPVKKDRGWER